VNTLLRLLAAAVLGVSLPAYALQGFDACVVAETESGAGTVDSVRAVPVARDIHAFDPDVLEHRVQPEEAQQLVVRLDAGPLVVFSAKEPRTFQPGQRVRVRLDGSVAPMEPGTAC
jgi:outer membrane lipoprotein SlyB